MERMSIAVEARKVVDLFERLSLVVPESDASARLDSAEVEDQYGRFKIFARNVGVFAAGHASLDYRLRQNEEAQAVARRLLLSLQWFLQRGMYMIQRGSSPF